MSTDADVEQISEKISTLFQGLDLDDVAAILKIQLAMLVTQGAEDAEGAMEFLDEIHEGVEEIVQGFPFGEDEEEADERAGEPIN